MINFFRKIRQRFLAENKVGKYLLYAIGEIVLVVIGILIALQINTWREGQINDKWELYYLNKLANDIQNDIDEINRNGIHAYRKVLVGNYMLKELEEKDYLNYLVLKEYLAASFVNEYKNKVNEDSLKLEHNILSTYRSTEFHKFTYNEIIASGRLEIIGNIKLRESITDYYWGTEDVLIMDKQLFDAQAAFDQYLTEENIPAFNNVEIDWISYFQGNKGYMTRLKNLMSANANTHGLYVLYTKSHATQVLSEIKQYLDSL